MAVLLRALITCLLMSVYESYVQISLSRKVFSSSSAAARARRQLFASQADTLSYVSVTLEAPVPTLGCTVEESLAEPGSVFVSCFPPPDCASR